MAAVQWRWGAGVAFRDSSFFSGSKFESAAAGELEREELDGGDLDLGLRDERDEEDVTDDELEDEDDEVGLVGGFL